MYNGVSCVSCLFITVRNKYQGESEARLKRFFSAIRKLCTRAAILIFMDELDDLLSSRTTNGGSETNYSLKNQFLTGVQGNGH